LKICKEGRYYTYKYLSFVIVVQKEMELMTLMFWRKKEMGSCRL